MDSRKDNIEVDSHLEQVLQDQNECPLCGTELLLTHVTNFVRWTVEEEAHCEACKIRTRKDKHALH